MASSSSHILQRTLSTTGIVGSGDSLMSTFGSEDQIQILGGTVARRRENRPPVDEPNYSLDSSHCMRLITDLTDRLVDMGEKVGGHISKARDGASVKEKCMETAKAVGKFAFGFFIAMPVLIALYTSAILVGTFIATPLSYLVKPFSPSAGNKLNFFKDQQTVEDLKKIELPQGEAAPTFFTNKDKALLRKIYHSATHRFVPLETRMKNLDQAFANLPPSDGDRIHFNNLQKLVHVEEELFARRMQSGVSFADAAQALDKAIAIALEPLDPQLKVLVLSNPMTVPEYKAYIKNQILVSTFQHENISRELWKRCVGDSLSEQTDAIQGLTTLLELAEKTSSPVGLSRFFQIASEEICERIMNASIPDQERKRCLNVIGVKFKRLGLDAMTSIAQSLNPKLREYEAQQKEKMAREAEIARNQAIAEKNQRFEMSRTELFGDLLNGQTASKQMQTLIDQLNQQSIECINAYNDMATVFNQNMDWISVARKTDPAYRKYIEALQTFRELEDKFDHIVCAYIPSKEEKEPLKNQQKVNEKFSNSQEVELNELREKIRFEQGKIDGLIQERQNIRSALADSSASQRDKTARRLPSIASSSSQLTRTTSFINHYDDDNRSEASDDDLRVEQLASIQYGKTLQRSPSMASSPSQLTRTASFIHNDDDNHSEVSTDDDLTVEQLTSITFN
jgi:hypothetical protein